MIAQVAGGSASKAWAGVSGVTNGMQSKMDEAFSGALYVQRRRQVAMAAETGFNNVLDIDLANYSKRVDGAMKMALGCSAAAAEADAILLDAINRVGPPKTQAGEGSDPVVVGGTGTAR